MLVLKVHWPQDGFCCSVFPLTKATGNAIHTGSVFAEGTRYYNLSLTAWPEHMYITQSASRALGQEKQMRRGRALSTFLGLPSLSLTIVSSSLMEAACLTVAEIIKKQESTPKWQRRKILNSSPPTDTTSTTMYKIIPLERDLKTE